MTYTELVTAVQDYLENTFSTADISLFIKQAETRTYNTIEFPSLSKTAAITFVANDPYLACPTDFIAAQSFAVIVSGVYTFLSNKDPNFMREAYSSPTSTGTPKYYAVYGPTVADVKLLRFIVGPTPPSALTGELQYFYYPESITVAVSGRTWLGDNFDPILLYGTLVEAYTQMKGDADMIALYDSKYKEAIALAKKLGDGRMKTDDYRSGGGRIQA